MSKIKIDPGLYGRAKKAAEVAGYSSLEEFITHILEKELALLEPSLEEEKSVADRLRGLGYID